MDTELGFVRARLEALNIAGMAAVAKAVGLNPRTVKRVRYKENASHDYATISKLATHFRTKEKRKRS